MKGRDIFYACDYADCYNEIHGDGSDTYAELTREAREEGWSIGNRYDFCPTHRSHARQIAALLKANKPARIPGTGSGFRPTDNDDGLVHFGY